MQQKTKGKREETSYLIKYLQSLEDLQKGRD